MRGRARSRLVGIALAGVMAVSAAGVALAASPTPSPKASKAAKAAKPAAQATDDAGVHGGPKPRFHDAAACNLTDVSKLDGNWTHGDYVSAVAAAGDEAKIQEAAHSRCGKPMHAGGPNAEAKAARKAAKAAEKAAAAKATPKPTPSTK